MGRVPENPTKRTGLVPSKIPDGGIAGIRLVNINLPPTLPHGLGTMTRRGIDATTIGLGKIIADKIARAFGAKNCECAAREACLNALVPDVRDMTAAKWAATVWKIRKCVRPAGSKKIQ